MYETFFGLRQKPFSLLPDPRFLYESPTHKVALRLLEYGLSEQAGFVVLTGEVGTGKTTLLRHLLHVVRDEVIVGLVNNTHASFGELIKWIMLAFDLDFRDKEQVEQHEVFSEFLINRYAEGKRCVLIIDEAQNLNEQALEQLRMLSNVNSEADHLLQLILVGQPELRIMLKRPELRQFVQRIGVDYNLEPLTFEETMRYIVHRLEVAGAPHALFTYEACAAVHYFSRGIPRLVNSLCDLALVYAYAEDIGDTVEMDTVIEAAQARVRGGLSAFAGLPENLSKEQVRAQILQASA